MALFFKDSFEFEDSPYLTMAKHLLPDYVTRDVRKAVLYRATIIDLQERIDRQSSQKHLETLEKQLDELCDQLESLKNKFGKPQRALFACWINTIMKRVREIRERQEKNDDSWLMKPTFGTGTTANYSHDDPEPGSPHDLTAQEMLEKQPVSAKHIEHNTEQDVAIPKGSTA